MGEQPAKPTTQSTSPTSEPTRVAHSSPNVPFIVLMYILIPSLLIILLLLCLKELTR